MSTSLLIAVCVISLLVAAASACAVQILHEFWRHELEAYCLRRGNLPWFRRIIEQRERMVLGAQTLQMISLGSGFAAAALMLVRDPAGFVSNSWWLPGLAGIASLVLLVACCWIPWTTLNTAAAPYLYRTWRIWWFASILFAPLIGAIQVLTLFFKRASGKEDIEESEEGNFEDEFMSMVSEGTHEGHLESDMREMIEGVFELEDSTVARVMTPRSKTDFVEVGTPWNELIGQVASYGRSRLPVVEGELSGRDSVVGILFVRDLLQEVIAADEKRKPLREVVRPPLFVPHTKSLDEMLEQFQAARSHMAIVLDEYHAVAGVITIEDVLEEIVGEIVDETDDDEPVPLNRIDDRTVEAEGATRLDVLNAALGLALPQDEDFDTLSGLLMSHLGSIPAAGQTITIDPIEVRILQATPRSIGRVRIKVLDANRTER